MKKLFSMILLAVVLFAACTHENDPVVKQIVTIQASIAHDSDSRVALGDGENEKKVSWTAGDVINLTINENLYPFTWQEGTTFAYSGNGELPSLTQDMQITATYASDYYITQTGDKEHVGNYMALSAEIRVSNGQNYGDLNFTFSHGTSVLKLTLSNEAFKDANVTDITLKAGAEVVAKTATETTFTGDAENGSVTVYFAIQPATLENVTIHATCSGNPYSSSLGNKTVVAGKLYTVDVQEVLPNCLIFEAEEDGQYLKIRPGDEEELNLQYSTNGTNWTDLESNTEVNFVDKKLFLRGTAVNGTNGATIGFDNEIRVACSGDIRTLMNYENYSDIQTSGNFQSLFYGCTSLTTAPALPATTLASKCYASMFYGCTSLTTASALPATILAEGCYRDMFSGCTSLTTAPALPATILASNCYSGMFSGCTSLNAAPALNATTLASMCYYYMFSACTSLNAAPALNATTLASRCYSGMFFGCTSLTIAPELNAATLASSCYYYMFSGCTSLSTAPALPATDLHEYCYESMFQGCTSLTIAPELNAETLASNCYRNMFSGCTSLTNAPALNAETLAFHCYESMFKGCTSLTIAPKLLATPLVDYCYWEMFSGCTNLSYVTMLATDIKATGCLNYWLEGAGKNASTRIIRVKNGGMIDSVKEVTPEIWEIESYM